MNRDAVAAVVTHGPRILFILRGSTSPLPGVWATVSGKVEAGEAQDAAVVREVAEEVDLVVKPLRKVWECLSIPTGYTMHWWLAHYVAGELRLDEREVAAARWVTAAEIATLEPLGSLNREFFATIFPALT